MTFFLQKTGRILLFTIFLSLFCLIYYFMAPAQTALPDNSWRNALGEGVGSTVMWLFTIIYGRTLLKLILRQGSMLDRLLPEGAWNDTAVPWARTLLRFLNKTHPYVGATVVILIFGHAWLEGLNQANLLMKIIMVLVIWQFAFGLFLLNRYQAVFIKKIKKYGYMAHSQLYTGIAIGICAAFGHLLVS